MCLLKNMGHQDLTLVCPEGVNPLLFSQLCVFHHSNTNNSNVLEVLSKPVSQQTEQIASPKPDGLCKKKTNKILMMLLDTSDRSQ